MAIRHHNRDIPPLPSSIPSNPNKPTSRELINLRPRPTIQMQRNPVPFLPRFITMPQYRRVVPSNLRRACPVRRRAVEVL